jgi:nitrogen fixation/metabolism regulation signal transduction histidine kinase
VSFCRRSRNLPDFHQFQESLLERLPVAVCACDRQGRITHHNQRAVEFWGGEPQPQQRFWGTARLCDSRGKLLDLLASPLAVVLHTGKPQYNRELVMERRDGSRVTILSNATPLFDSGKSLLGAVEVFQDITEQKWSEDAKRVAERLAASARIANQVMQQMARPLNSISSLLNVLRRDGSLSAEARACTELIQQELTRFDRLAREMDHLAMAA